jgi:K+-transporting ATPase KdpF subunit
MSVPPAPIAGKSQENKHAGHCDAGAGHGRIWPHARLCHSLHALVNGSGANPMFDYLLGGGVSLALLVYLVYALLRPEKF